jgi:Uma2 family endonuclease
MLNERSGGNEMSKKKAPNAKKTTADLVKEDHLSYDDYASLEDGHRYELVDGRLELMSPAPSVTHQLVSFELQKLIARSCESDYIILPAPVDVILANHEVRQPDLVLVHRKRIEILSNRGVVGAPDLVIEITSPSTLKRDKMELHSYSKYAIPEYWIVEPKAAILEQYIQEEGQYRLTDIFQENEQVTSPNITCINFSMAEIMEQIPKLD